MTNRCAPSAESRWRWSKLRWCAGSPRTRRPVHIRWPPSTPVPWSPICSSAVVGIPKTCFCSPQCTCTDERNNKKKKKKLFVRGQSIRSVRRHVSLPLQRRNSIFKLSFFRLAIHTHTHTHTHTRERWLENLVMKRQMRWIFRMIFFNKMSKKGMTNRRKINSKNATTQKPCFSPIRFKLKKKIQITRLNKFN